MAVDGWENKKKNANESRVTGTLIYGDRVPLGGSLWHCWLSSVDSIQRPARVHRRSAFFLSATGKYRRGGNNGRIMAVQPSWMFRNLRDLPRARFGDAAPRGESRELQLPGDDCFAQSWEHAAAKFRLHRIPRFRKLNGDWRPPEQAFPCLAEIQRDSLLRNNYISSAQCERWNLHARRGIIRPSVEFREEFSAGTITSRGSRVIHRAPAFFARFRFMGIHCSRRRSRPWDSEFLPSLPERGQLFQQIQVTHFPVCGKPFCYAEIRYLSLLALQFPIGSGHSRRGWQLQWMAGKIVELYISVFLRNGQFVGTMCLLLGERIGGNLVRAERELCHDERLIAYWTLPLACFICHHVHCWNRPLWI